MNAGLPDLLALNLFRWTVREGNITAAAARFGIGQPHASRIVARLQRRLGVALLVKVGRQLKPTDAGLLFLEEVDLALADLDNVWNNAHAISEGRTRPVRLLVQSHLAHGLMPMVLASLKSAMPRLRIDLDVRQKTRFGEWASRAATDAIFATLPIASPWGPPAQLFCTRYLLAVPSGNDLANRSVISMADAVRQPFIDVRPGLSTRDRLHEMANQLAVRPRIVMETGSVMSAVQLAAAGLGVALVDPFLAHLFAQDDRVRFRSISDGPVLTYCLAMGDPHAAWVQQLRQAIMQAVQHILIAQPR